MLEQEIEKQLVAEVNACDGKALKFMSPGCVGVPDRIVLLPGGKLGFVEVKSPGKKPRPIQERRIRQLRALGFLVFVVDGKEQIGGVLRAIQTT